MIGSTIGNYSIEGKLGEGGMGAVYKGRDLMLDREVAVKSLRPELAQMPELVNRFVEEAKTLARLHHSNIATLYSFHRQGGDFVMVMEFVRGRTLEAMIRESGPMDVVEAVRLFCQALEGIAHAHALGVVHRDIKPANIMLTRAGEVKVMDFGIARVLGTARQTRTGMLVGTLEYMSPEQLRGPEVDARADIYALGILLYEMLTGRVPFARASDYELIRAQVEEPPAPPRDLNARIPTEVEEIVLRALAKDPQARFQTAGEFRAALLTAVPQAAFKREPTYQVAEDNPAIKATRQAASLEEAGIADARLPATRLPQPSDNRSGFDRTTGTFTLKLPPFLLTARQRIEARVGPLNWKHYGSASAAALALIIGLSTLGGRTAKQEPTPTFAPAAAHEQPTIMPMQEAVAPALNPAPAELLSPTPKDNAERPPAPAATRTKPVRRQAAERPNVAVVATPSVPRPAPTPTPQQARPQQAQQQRPEQKPEPEKKRKWWEKAAEVGVGVTDAIIRKRNGRH